jgi:hypothetical protein
MALASPVQKGSLESGGSHQRTYGSPATHVQPKISRAGRQGASSPQNGERTVYLCRSMRISFLTGSLLAIISVAGCGAPAPAIAPSSAPPVPSSAPAPLACPGAIPAVADLELAPELPIAAKALGKEGDGRLCQAKAFRVKASMTVHRVWDGAKPESRIGRWWALEAPRGTTADYRRAYAICSEWSAANRSVSCKLKAGAEVVLGTGQSAKCADGTVYPAASTLQMFVADPASAIEGCTEGQAFP